MAARQGSDPVQVPPGSILLVIHDFTARSPDELALVKGDRIELIERDDDFGDGWFLGKHLGNGSTGLFPEVYTRLAPNPPGASHPGREPPASTPTATASKRAVSEDYSANVNPSNTNGARAHDRSSAPVTMDQASHNPVMNETLDVIKEHINDLKSPRGHLARQRSHDSASIYGLSENPRSSYIRGQETDEEDYVKHTKEQVSSWTAAQVSEYLDEQGVEKEHCQVFVEQEISGDVLLHMDQSSIFIKEFELGSVGRRLKTWQKVKALQDEVRAASAPAPQKAPFMPQTVGDQAAALRTSAATKTYLSPDTYTVQNPWTAPQTRASTFSHQSTASAPRPGSVSRPSAHDIRTMNHTRRQSSISSDTSMLQSPASPTATFQARRPEHARNNSTGTFDISQAKRASAYGHRYSLSGSSRLSQGPQEWGLGPMGSPDSADRGYFSGNELDKRTNRRSVLVKKSPASASHSRNQSEADISQSTVAKVDSPMHPLVTNSSMFSKVKAMRSASSPKTFGKTYTRETDSPTVTKLDYDSQRSPMFAGSETSSTGHSPSTNTFSIFHRTRTAGLRAASDSVTQAERPATKTATPTSPARTGSTTPSTETPSIDKEKLEQSRLSTGSSQNTSNPASSVQPSARARPGTRSKKQTSAYTRGLEKKTPREQIEGADYSGWMKKKSASLVGSWKPRLFVLRGRRLSYYYSENDTEEKGLIDISNHRVLPASSDRVTGLHAQLTGARTPQSPETLGTATVQTSAAADLLADPTSKFETSTGLFIFKLVPPRQGMSKAVNFTKPTVHYFAVNSRQEGRLWMAALMKATIDYDANGTVTTSYNQPTISLAKARARRERPPALREPASSSADKGAAANDDASGSVIDHGRDAVSAPTPADGQDDDSAAQRADSGRGLGIGGLDKAQPAPDAGVAAPAGDAEQDAGPGADEDDAGYDRELVARLSQEEAAALVA